jgi:hypothetical protein
MTNSEQLKNNFEKFYEMQKSNPLSMKELLYLFYLQGHNDPTPVGDEVDMKSVEEDIESQAFIDFIQSCIEHPKDDKLIPNDWVQVSYPCTFKDKQKCVAWPDRCEDAGGDGVTCGTTFINLSKLCGTETAGPMPKDTGLILTKEEAAKLSEILGKIEL